MELQQTKRPETTSATPDTSPEQQEPEQPPITHPYLKLFCAGFSFFYAGTNDGTTGPLLPYMLQTYHVSTGLVTVMYLSLFPTLPFSSPVQLTKNILATSLPLQDGSRQL